MGKMSQPFSSESFFSMPLILEDCRVRMVQNKPLRRIIIHVRYEMVNV